MTNLDFKYLKDSVKSRLQKIMELEAEMNQKMDSAKTQMHAGQTITIDGDTLGKIRKAIQTDYMGRIEALHAEIRDKLNTAQKEANQEYVNAMPRPTADERGEIDSLIREFNNSNEPNKEEIFIHERDFHLENETRLAKIYVLAGRDLHLSRTKLENTYSDAAMNAIHNATYGITPAVKLEQEALFFQIAPDMKTAQDHVNMVIDARRFYAIFDQLSLRDRLMNMTPDNFRHYGYTFWNDAMSAKISTKTKLFELGADPGMDLVTFIQSA